MLDFMAEKSLLGSILISPKETIPIARSIVRADDILDRRIRAAYIAACELADEGGTVDPVTVMKRAERTKAGTDGALMMDCMDTALTAANIKAYAQAVHDDATRRSIQALGMELAGNQQADPHELLRNAISKLQGIQTGSSAKPEEPTDTAVAFLNELQDTSEGKRRPFLSTGFDRLDKLLGGGLAAGGLITLAARTGTGKTTAGLCIADNVAAAGNAVLYVSLEMTKSQIMARRVGRLARLSYNRLQRGDIAPDDTETWDRITDAISKISKRPLYISDKPATETDVELKARSIPGLSLILIDHLGLIKSDNSRANLYQQTTETSHALKMLALSLGIPCLSLCQLNRESEGRPDHRPGLADLRNSGAIEEDSDSCIILHRPAMYLPESERPKPWEDQFLEINVAKNRHGTTGQESFIFRGLVATIAEK